MGDVIERLNVVPRRCTRNIKLVSILLSGLRHTAWLSMVIFAMLIVATRTGMAEQSERPGESGPTEIQASIIMLDLDSVNDANQSFEAAVYVELSWEDPSVLEDGATADDAWRPLVAISNQQQKWDVLPETLVIEADGRVRMRRSIWGSFSQPLDLRRFPFDSQEFSVTLLAEAGPEEIVFVQNADRPSGISSSLSVPDWDIQNTRSEGRFFYVSENIDPIPSFAMTVSAERRVQYYVYTMILPLVVIVAMSFVTFWIEPANFGTRLAVASTSMLTVVTYRVATVQVLPRTSYFTDMDLFIAGCTLLVFMALMATVVTTVIIRRDGSDGRARHIDIWARPTAPAALAFVAAAAFFPTT